MKPGLVCAWERQTCRDWARLTKRREMIEIRRRLVLVRRRLYREIKVGSARINSVTSGPMSQLLCWPP